MTGHQINSLVGDLVAMAQAMEELPKVRAELNSALSYVNTLEQRMMGREADLEQSRSYAASLEAKVHAAEASRDDAELRFLELDERAGKAIYLLSGIMEGFDLAKSEVTRSIALISPPAPMPEPIVSEVKPIAERSMDTVSITMISPSETASSAETSMDHADTSSSSQGQSEADPTAHASSQTVIVSDTASSNDPAPSWATPTTPKPQPYAGHSYGSWPSYVNRQDWIAGGGTNESYDDLPF